MRRDDWTEIPLFDEPEEDVRRTRLGNFVPNTDPDGDDDPSTDEDDASSVLSVSGSVVTEASELLSLYLVPHRAYRDGRIVIRDRDLVPIAEALLGDLLTGKARKARP